MSTSTAIEALALIALIALVVAVNRVGLAIVALIEVAAQALRPQVILKADDPPVPPFEMDEEEDAPNPYASAGLSEEEAFLLEQEERQTHGADAGRTCSGWMESDEREAEMEEQARADRPLRAVR